MSSPSIASRSNATRRTSWSCILDTQGVETAFFQLPAEGSEMISFCLFDLQDRITKLKDGLFKRGECD